MEYNQITYTAEQLREIEEGVKRSLEIIAVDEREALLRTEHIASLMGLEFSAGPGTEAKIESRSESKKRRRRLQLRRIQTDPWENKRHVRVQTQRSVRDAEVQAEPIEKLFNMGLP